MIAVLAAIGIGMATFAVAYQAMPYIAPLAPGIDRGFRPIKDQSRVPDYIVPRVVQTVKYTRPIGVAKKAVKKVATKKKVKRRYRYVESRHW